MRGGLSLSSGWSSTQARTGTRRPGADGYFFVVVRPPRRAVGASLRKGCARARCVLAAPAASPRGVNVSSVRTTPTAVRRGAAGARACYWSGERRGVVCTERTAPTLDAYGARNAPPSPCCACCAAAGSAAWLTVQASALEDPAALLRRISSASATQLLEARKNNKLADAAAWRCSSSAPSFAFGAAVPTPPRRAHVQVWRHSCRSRRRTRYRQRAAGGGEHRHTPLLYAYHRPGSFSLSAARPPCLRPLVLTRARRPDRQPQRLGPPPRPAGPLGNPRPPRGAIPRPPAAAAAGARSEGIRARPAPPFAGRLQ